MQFVLRVMPVNLALDDFQLLSLVARQGYGKCLNFVRSEARSNLHV